MIIFVTGHHGAGTHALAEHMAKANNLELGNRLGKYNKGLSYINESWINADKFELLVRLITYKELYVKVKYKKSGKVKWKFKPFPELSSGFVLHCPRLAHKAHVLKPCGKVVWAARGKETLIQTQRLMNTPDESFIMMRNYHDENPNDIIWNCMQYDGSDDPLYGYVKHLSLLHTVKEHFKDPQIEEYRLEEMPYYDSEKPKTAENPMLDHIKAMI